MGSDKSSKLVLLWLICIHLAWGTKWTVLRCLWKFSDFIVFVGIMHMWVSTVKKVTMFFFSTPDWSKMWLSVLIFLVGFYPNSWISWNTCMVFFCFCFCFFFRFTFAPKLISFFLELSLTRKLHPFLYM